MLTLRLVDNWKTIVRRAWSVHLVIIAAALSGAEVGLAFFGPGAVPAGIFAAGSGLVTAAAFVARLFAQQSISGD